MSDDFCIIHGYDHMRSQMGNPIPYCDACENERCSCGTQPKGSCPDCIDYGKQEEQMAITYGDYLIDSGANDITPEQEREIEAREECARRGLDPDDDAADAVLVWMVVSKELQERR